MTILFILLFLLILGPFVFVLINNKQLQDDLLRAQNDAQAAQTSAEQRIEATRQESSASVAAAQKLIDQQFAAMQQEAERVRLHYEAEARRLAAAANALATKTINELEPLRKYQRLGDAQAVVQRQLADALKEASSLRAEAQSLLEQARNTAAHERALAIQKAKDIREQADALLNQATLDAGRIMAEAEKRAEQIGGDAYIALRDKQLLERAAAAMRNVIEGYGDRYIIPTHSLLDDLAVEFDYNVAGQALKAAREQSRRMVGQGAAAACDYVETNRQEIAIRFVVDAFNGRVDAILSRSRHDNYGTLEQEIRDAFSLVNLNGQAFRNARILPAYLDARLAELKWAVVVRELARKQQEEQRYLKERLRDEEKARKEYEEKIRQAAKEEEMKRKAVEEAERKYESATAEQKAQFEQELQKLRQDLADASQRKLTIAQQTKKGHVYIISNIGSFGEGIYKIGQTRRPEPQDRVDELGGASVPFEFDVHALIETENAPALEHKIHKQLLAMQVNKINYRKEFFRIRLTDIHQEIDKLKTGEDFTVKVWTELAVASEYKDSIDIENNPEKKEKWLKRQQDQSARQLQLDKLPLLVQESVETNGDNQEE